MDVLDWLLVTLFVFIQKKAEGLAITNFYVPSLLSQGESVKLVCEYSHTDRVPYSIKWYRGSDNFYEFKPGAKAKKKSYTFPGIGVDLGSSEGSGVTLNRVNKMTSGVFRCEITEGEPLFQTHSQNETMKVVETPRWGPDISGIEHRQEVKLGDEVVAKCTIAHSDPLASLSWTVNGRKPNAWAKVTDSFTEDIRGKNIPETVVRFQLSSHSFIKGVAEIGCTAQIPPIYSKSIKVDLLDEHRPRAGLLGWWFSAGSHATASHLLVVPVTLSLCAP